MMSNTVIKVENLSKRYRIGLKEKIHETFLGALISWVKSPIYNFRRLQKLSQFVEHENSDDIIWALRSISFEVKHGEVLGIIGRNGSGKSTLLKILSRITEPTEGRAQIIGRVGSLLEVGTGFHPELTGRENIYLNSAILGMKKAETDRKFDEIVDFAEVEKFIDTPVKRYSSGMYVRLAFAVAAYLEPEILLVDEVLAVGDVAFQKKCLGKISDVAKEGRTVLFVSHNMAVISNLCERCLLLDSGRIVIDGSVNASIECYISSIQTLNQFIPLHSRVDRQGNGRLRFTNFKISSPTRAITDTVVTGENVSLTIEYEADSEKLKNVSISIPFYNHLGQPIFMCWTRLVGQDFELVERRGRFIVEIPKLPLMPGKYSLNLYCEVNGVLADWIQEAVSITVLEGDFFGTGMTLPSVTGGVAIEHSWRYETSEAN